MPKPRVKLEGVQRAELLRVDPEDETGPRLSDDTLSDTFRSYPIRGARIPRRALRVMATHGVGHTPRPASAVPSRHAAFSHWCDSGGRDSERAAFS